MWVARAVLGILVALAFGAGLPACGPPRALPAGSLGATSLQGDTLVSARATGSFDVRLTPQATEEAGEGVPIGRLTIDKVFRGDLEGTSRGEMLTAVTPVEGSAGYVALERVSGALHGREGTFVLQHSGTMTRGSPHLRLSVVPDSGTGQLVGLAGTMAIEIAQGRHSYDFRYNLPDGR